MVEDSVAFAELPALLEQGLHLCQRGAFSDAEQLYRRITSSHPETPDAWNMLAVLLYQRNELREAGSAAEHATALRPHIAPYWLTRGNIALAQLQSAEAQQCFRRAIELEPAFSAAHYRHGLSLELEMRHAEAAEAYRTAAAYAPDVAEIHFRLAEVLLAMDQPALAVASYHEAFARDPAGSLDRHGCFECLERWRFETLPAFWDGEIRRFFTADRDKAQYARVGLKALKARPTFRSMLCGTPTIGPRLGKELRRALRDPLLLALLSDCLIADADVERFLTSLRRGVLLDPALRDQVPLDFLCALALQCFNNEYVYAHGQEEGSVLKSLRASVERELRSGRTVAEAILRATVSVAMYASLEGLDGVDALLSRKGMPDRLKTLLERSVADVRAERELRKEIGSMGSITEAVSCAVQAMYEEHPYPRWFALDRNTPVPLSQWLAQEIPAAPQISEQGPIRVLVAGCGTGRDALGLAMAVRDLDVLAVDLSISSLAHALRMARALGVENVTFRQADILCLEECTEPFDLIVSTGVLHHMRDPAAGLRVLARLLRPGGLIKLGLYSARARRSVTAARDIISRRRLPATEAAIRTFRQEVLHAEPESSLYPLQYSNDFYSMSMCRDLLFHVQEHQYRFPQIAAMLKANRLNLLGLTELPRETHARYCAMFPDDAQMVDALNWDLLEERYPDTFSKMFVIWAQLEHAA